MKFTETKVSTEKEILKRKLGGELTEPITLDSTAFTDGVCKAGNPISAEGQKVNGGDSDADPIGILLNDVYVENPNGTIVRAFACVNEKNANENAEITIAATVKTKLSNIVFE